MWDDQEVENQLCGVAMGEPALESALAQFRALGQQRAPDPRADVAALLERRVVPGARRKVAAAAVATVSLATVSLAGAAAASETAWNPLPAILQKLVDDIHPSPPPAEPVPRNRPSVGEPATTAGGRGDSSDDDTRLRGNPGAGEGSRRPGGSAASLGGVGIGSHVGQGHSGQDADHAAGHGGPRSIGNARSSADGQEPGSSSRGEHGTGSHPQQGPGGKGHSQGNGSNGNGQGKLRHQGHGPGGSSGRANDPGPHSQGTASGHVHNQGRGSSSWHTPYHGHSHGHPPNHGHSSGHSHGHGGHSHRGHGHG
jgi:hypothetical protein